MNENERKWSSKICMDFDNQLKGKNVLQETLQCDPDSIFTLNLVAYLFIRYCTHIHAHSWINDECLPVCNFPAIDAVTAISSKERRTLTGCILPRDRRRFVSFAEVVAFSCSSPVFSHTSCFFLFVLVFSSYSSSSLAETARVSVATGATRSFCFFTAKPRGRDGLRQRNYCKSVPSMNRLLSTQSPFCSPEPNGYLDICRLSFGMSTNPESIFSIISHAFLLFLFILMSVLRYCWKHTNYQRIKDILSSSLKLLNIASGKFIFFIYLTLPFATSVK